MGALYFLLSRDFTGLILFILSSLVIIFLAQPVHEFAHGWVAYKLGDTTAKFQGRLTLNPMAHLDPLGALSILLFGIGWARPVPVNPYNFKHRKRDMAITALAGPLSNIIVSILLVIVLNIFYLIFGFSVPMQYFTIFVQYFVSINCVLAVFNLLPIPPLDGSRIFGAILPDRWAFKMAQYEQYIRFGLFILLFTGVLSPVIRFLQTHALNIVFWVANLPFRLFGLM